MIPDGWEKRDLKGLIHIKHGFAFKSEYFSANGEYVLLTPGSFYESGGFRDQGGKTKYYNGEIPDGYLLPKDAMLLAMTEQAAGLLGSALMVPDSNKYLHNQRLGLVVILQPKRVNREFLYLHFNSPSVRKQISEQSTGTKVKHTSPERLCSAIGLLPPLPEQKKIAQILSTWDKAIATTEKLLANSQQQKKALMQQLLTGKKRLLDKNGVRFSGEWDLKMIKDFFEVGSSKRVLQENWESKGIPFYRTRELVALNEGKPFSSEIFISRELYGELAESYGVPKTDDFLVSGVGTLGVFYKVTSDEAFYFKDGNVLWFKRKENVFSDFFNFLFQSSFVQNQIDKQAAITTVATYTIKNAKVTKVRCPSSVDEQLEIVRVLRAANAAIANCRFRLEALKSEKKALMQQLLTGKRRVKTDEAPE